MRHTGHLRRFAAAVLLTSQLTGCTRWQVHHLSPRRLIAEQRPSVVLVSWAGRRSYVLERPFIVQDSLVGRERSTLRRIAIPLAEVEQIQIRRAASGNTAALGLGIAAGVALGLYLLYVVLVGGDNS